MNIVNVRVDDRLVHGVVATTWIPKLQIERVIVIDKESAENPVMKNILRMATPTNVRLSVLTPEKAISNLKVDRYGMERLMIVIKELEVLIELSNHDIAIEKCTMGNYGNINRTNGIAITKYLTVDESSAKKVIYLHDQGLKLIAQLVPDDQPQDFYQLMNAKIKK
ncbi:PTS sugar transporter subunit IIB [[Eubacterium] hominis]|uniref:PTS sugar transporter subunit IIB n=1 Tax=[Eubacterium] hominis TaxID=2764325 RepID=UPI003A4E45B2